MKKKLIAAILSVAMVASMVPATAFAATGGAAKAKTSVAATKAATITSIVKDATDASGATLTADAATGNLTVTGTVKHDLTSNKNEIKVVIEGVSDDSGFTHWKYDIAGAGAGAAIAKGTSASETIELTAAKAAAGIPIVVTYYKDDSGTAIDGTTKSTTVTVNFKDAKLQTEAEAKAELADVFDTALAAIPTTSVGVKKEDADKAQKALVKAYTEANAAGALTDTQKQKYAKANEDLGIIIDQIDARDMIALIKAIPTAISIDDKAAIDAARAMYDTPLSDKVRAQVTNYSDLTDAEAAFDAVDAINTAVVDGTLTITEFANINTVKALVNETNGTLTLKLAGLNNKQSNRVGNIAKYNAAVKNVANLDADTKIVADLGKELAKVTSVTTQSEINATQLLIANSDIAFNKADKIVTKAGVAVADTYTREKTRVQGLIDKALEKAEAQKAADELVAKINALPKEADLVLTDMAKVDALQFEYDDTDTAVKTLVNSAKAQYTLSTAKAKTDSLKAAAKKAATTDALKETYTKTIIDAYVTNAKLDNKPAVNAADAALADSFLVNTADLINAKATVAVAKMNIEKDEALSAAAVKKVVDLIDNMGTSTSLAFKVNVQNARTAYDALTADQKKKVTNYTKLTAAEESIKNMDVDVASKEAASKAIAAYTALPTAAKDPKTLVLADKDKIYEIRDLVELEGVKTWIKTNGTTEDKAALSAIESLIAQMDVLTTTDFDKQAAALVPVKSDASKADIDAAAKVVKELRAQYDGFSKGQKDQVKNLAKLTAAEEAISTATINHANVQLEKIAKFDFEKLTADDIAVIKEEKACIAELTEAQIAKLNETNYNIFIKQALPALDKETADKGSLEKAKVEAANVVYNAKSQKPVVKVTDRDGNVVDAKDYRVTYSDNKEVGKATITISSVTGGAYTGSAVGSFIITPAKDTVTSLQVAKAVLRVNMKAMPEANHQIYYKLTSGDTYSRVNTSANTKRLTSANGIKAKKKYTVKVRAYKSVDGKTYYGAFSSLARKTTK